MFGIAVLAQNGRTIFKRPVPLLIHELEYYEEIAEQNEAANPPELVASFARWARGADDANETPGGQG